MIRRAMSADERAMFDLVAQFATSFAAERRAFETSLMRLLTTESACVLVAEAEGKLVGYCLGFMHETFYANGPVAWVEEIMVLDTVRRQRIGQQLMIAFEEWASDRG